MITRAKVSRKSVNYRPTASATRHCASCAMYHRDGSCDILNGKVDPKAVCDKWVKRG